jgi:hypothetical protein
MQSAAMLLFDFAAYNLDAHAERLLGGINEMQAMRI